MQFTTKDTKARATRLEETFEALPSPAGRRVEGRPDRALRTWNSFVTFVLSVVEWRRGTETAGDRSHVRTGQPAAKHGCPIDREIAASILAVGVFVVGAITVWRLAPPKPQAQRVTAPRQLAARPLQERGQAALRQAPQRQPPSRAPTTGPCPICRRRCATPRSTASCSPTATDASSSRPDRRLFDYFFSASGEEADEVILARIQAAIDASLPPRRGTGARVARPLCRVPRASPHPVRRRRGRSRSRPQGGRDPRAAAGCLRRREAAALFADDGERERFAVEAQRRLADASLSPAQRRDVLEDLEGAMPDSGAPNATPPWDRCAWRAMSRLRQAGGSPEEIARCARRASARRPPTASTISTAAGRLAATPRLLPRRACAIDADASLTPEQR